MSITIIETSPAEETVTVAAPMEVELRATEWNIYRNGKRIGYLGSRPYVLDGPWTSGWWVDGCHEYHPFATRDEAIAAVIANGTPI